MLSMTTLQTATACLGVQLPGRAFGSLASCPCLDQCLLSPGDLNLKKRTSCKV